MSAPLVLTDVAAGYGGVPVVRDISFAVKPGEIVALFGANGAGKTTLLRAISGLQPTLAGRVEVLGRNVDTRRPHILARRGLALVSDDRGLFTQLTVAENLRLARPRGGRAATDTALDTFPALRAIPRRAAGLLSGGEQQMLALARALQRRPRVLLVDEMTLGLAPIVARSLLPAVRAAAEDGAAVILVEQHVHLALEIADRVLVLARGRLVLDEPAAELRADLTRLEFAYLDGEVGD
ncbi:MAG: ABC transporter ATP-binding protein [Actinomycetota bacterium]|nr:ABC transporter ATP-binding protein [Actinomycetota bacterium]